MFAMENVRTPHWCRQISVVCVIACTWAQVYASVGLCILFVRWSFFLYSGKVLLHKHNMFYVCVVQGLAFFRILCTSNEVAIILSRENWVCQLPQRLCGHYGFRQSIRIMVVRKKNQASRGRVMITVSGFFLAQNLIASKMGDQRICNYREKKMSRCHWWCPAIMIIMKIGIMYLLQHFQH